MVLEGYPPGGSSHEPDLTPFRPWTPSLILAHEITKSRSPKIHIAASENAAWVPNVFPATLFPKSDPHLQFLFRAPFWASHIGPPKRPLEATETTTQEGGSSSAVIIAGVLPAMMSRRSGRRRSVQCRWSTSVPRWVRAPRCTRTKRPTPKHSIHCFDFQKKSVQ